MIPPPIRGLGQAGGFQMMVEDRRSLGLPELQKGVQELTRAGSTQSGLGFVGSTFSNRSPQLYLDIDRTKAQSQEVPLSNVFATLQAYLGSAYVNLFNKFNQSFQVYVQADAPYRLRPEDIENLYVKNVREEMVPLGSLLTVKHMLGSELVTRYNLYPAAPVFGSAAPGSSSADGADRQEHLAARHELRMDRHRIPGKAARQPGVLHLSSVHRSGFPGAGRSIRKLGQPRRGDPGRTHGSGGRHRRPHHPPLRQQPVHPGRPGTDDRAGQQERHPGGGIRPGTAHRRHGHRRRRGGSHPAPVPAHHHDLVRFHPGRPL
ncbi:hypothetical protein [Plasmodium yoelii yoelii]|uniref:Uncharacterized protein n=1 Tax=Plasmodium yoelii yoelii TaxID=73239 RepID=Q7R784_PLAYO|nr:hypothetical protein [Plasmodium yoelii yoelii]